MEKINHLQRVLRGDCRKKAWLLTKSYDSTYIFPKLKMYMFTDGSSFDLFLIENMRYERERWLCLFRKRMRRAIGTTNIFWPYYHPFAPNYQLPYSLVPDKRSSRLSIFENFPTYSDLIWENFCSSNFKIFKDILSIFWIISVCQSYIDVKNEWLSLGIGIKNINSYLIFRYVFPNLPSLAYLDPLA